MSAVEEIAALLTHKFGVQAAAVRPEAPLRGLGMDSLALEELRLLIEEHWEIDLEDVPLTSRDTVRQLVAAVDNKIAA